MTTRYRVSSLAASLALLACAFAAKFYTGPLDQFADRYLADFFIVGWLYFLLSAAGPRLGPWSKGAAIWGLAVAVELFQATGIPASPRMPRLLAFWIGTTFDPWDLLSYTAGTLLALAIDRSLRRWCRPNGA